MVSSRLRRTRELCCGGRITTDGEPGKNRGGCRGRNPALSVPRHSYRAELSNSFKPGLFPGEKVK
jgi:hypothetical protein